MSLFVETCIYKMVSYVVVLINHAHVCIATKLAISIDLRSKSFANFQA